MDAELTVGRSHQSRRLPSTPMPESKRRKPKYSGPTPSRKPKEVTREPSPSWYVVLMFAFMALGVALVLLRYFLSWDNIWLIVGLAFIGGGFLMTTSYR